MGHPPEPHHHDYYKTTNLRERRLDLALGNAVPILAVLVYATAQAVDKGFHLIPGSTSAKASDLLWFALICGLGSYATIELLKRVVRIRGWYQLWQTRRWLNRSSTPNAYDQLLQALGIAPGELALRVFNLPTEQLSAQIGAAADIALANTGRYGDLIKNLAGEIPADLGKYLHRSSEAADVGIRLIPETEWERELLLELSQQIRLGIDRLQISLGEQWRRTMQGAAVWIAGLYGIALSSHGAMGLSSIDPYRSPSSARLFFQSEPRYVLAAVLLGGPLAWLLRDLTALVERVRR